MLFLQNNQLLVFINLHWMVQQEYKSCIKTVTFYKQLLSASKMMMIKGGKINILGCKALKRDRESESMSCKQTANPIWHFDPEMD